MSNQAIVETAAVEEVKKPLFVQAGCGEAYSAMIDDHMDRHVAYCKKWDIDYAHIKLGELQNYDHYWFRVPYLIENMKSGKWSHVIMADSDVMVVDFHYDMREALPDWAFLGMVMYPFPSPFEACHLNAGVMYVRSCDEAIEFFEHIMDRRNQRSGNLGWCEQAVINDLFINNPRWQKGIRVLSRRWNNNLHDATAIANPIVAGFHGWGSPDQRRDIMLAYAADNPWE